MDSGGSEGPSDRELAAVRVLNESSTIPLDQEGPVMVPPLGRWQILIQRVRCHLGRHAWGPAWIFRPLVPAEHDVARMIAHGAGWPQYESKICLGCGLMSRTRVA